MRCCIGRRYRFVVLFFTAEVLIEVLGGKGLENGQFFVYQREGKSADQEVVLCVVYKGKGTHHLMQLVDGNWVVNKKSFGSNSTLGKVMPERPI